MLWLLNIEKVKKEDTIIIILINARLITITTTMIDPTSYRRDIFAIIDIINSAIVLHSITIAISFVTNGLDWKWSEKLVST